MGIFDRAIKRGVSRALGDAVEKGVRSAIAPKVEQVAENAVNSAAGKINEAIGVKPDAQQNMQAPRPQYQNEASQAASALGGLFSGYTGALQNFANEAAKNIKICPSCGEGAGRDVKFCPSCGSKLPDTTVAESSVCPSCGKQNGAGTKFCADCGTKLPSAVAAELAAKKKSEEMLLRWDALLAQYPKWNGGGEEYNIEQYDGYVMFSAKCANSYAAQNAVKQYRELLQQNGFRMAGQYPLIDHLYKKENGVCFHVDTEHCFEGDSDAPAIYFNNEEPTGGFDYVKAEQKPKGFGLFDFIK